MRRLDERPSLSQESHANKLASAGGLGRLEEACAFALEKHAGQVRKGTSIPYVSHLLQVAGLVLEHGGDVDQAVAGLLHDALEDTDTTVQEVREAFGDEVTRIVEACTDTLPGDTPEKKGPYVERKSRYLAHLREADAAVLLVAGCDKLDNLRSLLADLHAEGAATLTRFNGTPAEILGYYRGVLDAARGRVPRRLERELEVLTEELAGFVGGAA